MVTGVAYRCCLPVLMKHRKGRRDGWGEGEKEFGVLRNQKNGFCCDGGENGFGGVRGENGFGAPAGEWGLVR